MQDRIQSQPEQKLDQRDRGRDDLGYDGLRSRSLAEGERLPRIKAKTNDARRALGFSSVDQEPPQQHSKAKDRYHVRSQDHELTKRVSIAYEVR